jgi:predicted ATPase
MDGYCTYLADEAFSQRDPRFHEMSHGESFPALLGSRFDSPGLY